MIYAMHLCRWPGGYGISQSMALRSCDPWQTMSERKCYALAGRQAAGQCPHSLTCKVHVNPLKLVILLLPCMQYKHATQPNRSGHQSSASSCLDTSGTCSRHTGHLFDRMQVAHMMHSVISGTGRTLTPAPPPPPLAALHAMRLATPVVTGCALHVAGM
jgi:hypothetical protein